MKQIMIVDDEFLVRIGIKSMLDWEAKGYSIVCEAINGQDAIEKLGQYTPQILLTDIVMEPVNGLELIKYCAAHYPDIRIVVLSNYNDFEKVRTAMKLGARDFLFKLTTSPTELLEVLEGISKEIDRHHMSGKDTELMLVRNAGAIRQRLISMMIESSHLNDTNLLSELRMVDVRCDFTKPYVVLYISVANYNLLQNAGKVLEPGLFEVSLENIVSEFMDKACISQTFRYENGKCIVVINTEREIPDSEIIKKVVASFEQIDTGVRRYFGMRISGALSRGCVGVKSLSAAVVDCQRVIKESFRLKENRLLFCAHEKPAVREIKMLPEYWISDWQTILEHFQLEEAGGFIRRVIDYFYGLEGTESYLIREKLFELYRALKTDSLSKGIVLENLTDEHGLSLYQAISQYDLLSNISESFLTILRRYETESYKSSEKRLKKEIAEVIAYINAHLSDNLSVVAAARMVHMSESYFSHLFKNEMGIGFVEYINRLRIEKAKEMLIQTDLRINEIAFRVGIDNPNYFSILFKKIVNVSPYEFRNNPTAENRYKSIN